MKRPIPTSCSLPAYPPDTVGIIRAANEVGLKTKMFGGNMIGLLAAILRTQLGPLLNGIVSTADTFVPAPKFNFPGVAEVIAKYQARATGEGLDPLGFNYAPYGYAAMQVLAQAVEATKSLDHDKLADYMHKATFSTVVGEITYGPEGEWTKSRVIVSQFQGISGNDVAQFKDMRRQVIVWPPEYKSGELIYPYADAKNRRRAAGAPRPRGSRIGLGRRSPTPCILVAHRLHSVS